MPTPNYHTGRRIVQILPARAGVGAYFKHGDGDHTVRVVHAWALVVETDYAGTLQACRADHAECPVIDSNQEVVPLVVMDGRLEPATDIDDFENVLEDGETAEAYEQEAAKALAALQTQRQQ